MFLLVLTVACVVAYLIGRRRDRRMLRNGVFLSGAILFAALFVADVLARRFAVAQTLLVSAFVLMPIALVVLAVFLLANGVRMFRREGRSLGNMLSFAAGAVIVVLVGAAAALLGARSSIAAVVLGLVIVIVAYFGAIFCVFLVSALAYGRNRLPAQADVVVILGSGLVRGQVPPLLRSRLDRAIAVYRRSVDAGVRPLMIPSGGQGADEPRAEGEAMAEYLIDQGLPAEAVRAETASRNTRENLLLSQRVQQDAGAEGDIVVVTNNYHVMRSAMLARSLGLGAQVVGAPTARYYVPSAFLREFLAVVSAHRRAHAVVVACVVALWAWVLVGTVLPH